MAWYERNLFSSIPPVKDFRVHVKYQSDTSTSPNYERLPYFCLPGDVARVAIADSCLACFDYTNALADVVIGYMAAPYDNSDFNMHLSQQTITIRNAKGEKMVQRAMDSGRLEVGSIATGSGRYESFASATVSSDSIVQGMLGGEIRDRGMPRLLGDIMATLLTSIGPKGVNFARYSIDYHVLRNYLHVLDEWGDTVATKMLPEYSEAIVKHYLDTDAGFKKIVQTISSKRT